MEAQIEGLRLAPQQQHLWLRQYDVGPYIAQCALQLDGSLQIKPLQDALQSIVERHEVLRVGFYQKPGIKLPVQVIHEEASYVWKQTGLGKTAVAERPNLIRQQLEKERIRPFNLEQGPLLHVHLLTFSEKEHVLLLSLPALCIDAWSFNNLTQELSELYTANLRGEKIKASEPDEILQYFDFSEWQNELLLEEDAEDGKAYWQRQNLLTRPPLTLPFEQLALEQELFKPAVVRTVIPAESVNQAEPFAHELQASLLACWKTLLWRLTGEKEICVGYIYDGRSFAEFHQGLGLFARHIPTCTSLAAGLTLPELSQKIANTLDEGSEWSEYFVWERDNAFYEATDRLPICFEFEELATSIETTNVTFSIQQKQVFVDRYKLKLSASLRNGEILLDFHYDQTFFDKVDMHRLAAMFQTLWQSLITDPGAKINQVDILGAQERQQQLVQFNNTQTSYPDNKGVHQFFEQQASRTPGHIAVRFGQQSLTYEQLNRRANQAAHYLQKLGVGPEVFVAFQLNRSPEMIIAILAILKAGGTYVPLDTMYPPERLQFILEDTQASVLLTQNSLKDVLPTDDIHKICIDSDWHKIDKEPGYNPGCKTNAESLAYVLYTSGSTGRPKGVMVTHRGLTNYLSWSLKTYQKEHGQGAPVHSPIGFDLTVTSLFVPLLSGQSLTLVSETQTIEGFSSLLKNKCDFSLIKLTPTHLSLLSQLLTADEVKGQTGTLVIGGESLLADTLSFWQTHAPETRLINEYGPTEAVVGCCTYEVSPNDPSTGTVPIGQPVANTQIYILDKHQQLVPSGVPGELYIAGDGLARGYLNRPGLTATKFIPNPFSDAPGARLYQSGDLARRRPDGQLEFLGRTDHQVKVHGYRIELGEIEVLLNQHSAIREAVVITYEDSFHKQRLAAYFIASEEETLSTDELRLFLEQKLPGYMVPSIFIPLTTLPLTTNGKLDRKALPAPDQARPNLSENYVAPRSEVEEILAEVWADSLELERIGIFDNFFVLGGDSIRSVRAVALAKEKGLNLTVQQLFQYQTIDRTIQELGETIFYSETEQETPSDPEELLAHLLDEVEGLSDSEIDALLHEKLQKRPAQETST